MKKALDVTVIGTEPPCPRCDLLGLLVQQSAPAGIRLHLHHCAWDSPEAGEIGRRFNRKVGTAKQVAQDIGISVDWQAVHACIEKQSASLPPNSRPADAWTSELDRLLEPCRRAADRSDWFMTPVLVINGRVRHHGNVPSPEQVAVLLQKTADERQGEATR